MDTRRIRVSVFGINKRLAALLLNNNSLERPTATATSFRQPSIISSNLSD